MSPSVAAITVTCTFLKFDIVTMSHLLSRIAKMKKEKNEKEKASCTWCFLQGCKTKGMITIVAFEEFFSVNNESSIWLLNYSSKFCEGIFHPGLKVRKAIYLSAASLGFTFPFYDSCSVSLCESKFVLMCWLRMFIYLFIYSFRYLLHFFFSHHQCYHLYFLSCFLSSFGWKTGHEVQKGKHIIFW